MKVVLISTYDLGRQPFGLASPAAWLRTAGHQVTSADLSVGTLPILETKEAALVAFHLPMHTATRLAVPLIERIRRMNPAAHLCCFGLYAPPNEQYLRSLGVHTVLGGEFEPALARLAANLPDAPQIEPLISLERIPFLTPDRAGLPGLNRYPKLVTIAGKRRIGYTESSRGCKHLCRHCPIVPVYQGAFRVVPSDVVLADIRQQAHAGAEHVTFGDPDFLNGPGHARKIIEALHSEFPSLTYDVTIKIEHLLKHRELIPVLKQTGCLFVTTAVEAVDDAVLHHLAKGHTRADFEEVAGLLRDPGLAISPTFIPFTPWTTVQSYRELLQVILDLDLVDSVAPVQLSLRLLIPAGSRLLELDDIRRVTSHFDPENLVWHWRHPDPAIDELARQVLKVLHEGTRTAKPRRAIFEQYWACVQTEPLPQDFDLMPRATIPFLEEPWFC